MRPTLAAAQLRGSPTQYLTTTYALADEDTRGALERFSGPPETGIFRGPYLRGSGRRSTPPRTAGSGNWSGPRASCHGGTRPGHGSG